MNTQSPAQVAPGQRYLEKIAAFDHPGVNSRLAAVLRSDRNRFRDLRKAEGAGDRGADDTGGDQRGELIIIAVIWSALALLNQLASQKPRIAMSRKMKGCAGAVNGLPLIAL